MRFVLAFFLSFFIINITSLNSFSEENKKIITQTFNKLEDISFQVIREEMSLEKILADNEFDLTMNVLHLMNTERKDKMFELYSDEGIDLPQATKEMLSFFLYENKLKKLALNKKEILIEQWIDAKISAKDISDLMYEDTELKILKALDKKDTVIYMPHLFLNIADTDVIKKVFQTKGFDPYFKTSLGNNLLHSFLFLGWINKLSIRDIPEKDYNKAFKLLIELSPPELLTQKNNIGFTPIALSILLNESHLFHLLMKSMKEKDIIKELPNLEKQTIYKTLYPFLNSIQDFRIKMNKVDQFIMLGSQGEILVNFPSKKNQIGKASFTSLNKNHYFSRFHFFSLISGLVLPQIFEEFFTKSHEYENNRIVSLSETFLSPDKKEMKEVIQSIIERDIKTFKQNIKTVNDENLLKNYSYIDLSEAILEESIRSQFEEGVQYVIETMKPSFKDGNLYHPLFLAMLSYSSLNQNHPRKQTAKKIIDTVTSATINNLQNIDQKTSQEMIEGFIFWATFFNLYDQVVLLSSTKYFNSKTMNLRKLTMYMEYALEKNHIKIYNYLLKKLNNHPEVISVDCKKIFIH